MIPECTGIAYRNRLWLELAHGECSKCGCDLGGYRRFVVKPAGFYDVFELLDQDTPARYPGTRARHLLVPARHIVIRRKDRHSAPRVPHFVLNFPFLCRDYDDAIFRDGVGDYGNQSLRAAGLSVALGYIRELDIGDDGYV
jgi:hypothetical protein